MSTHSSGYYSIDADYNIIGFNDTAKQIYPSLKVGQKCYKTLMGLDAHIANTFILMINQPQAVSLIYFSSGKEKSEDLTLCRIA